MAGAFDRVDSNIFLAKCRRAGLHPKILRFLQSWLSGRCGIVVTRGKKLLIFFMSNMVFQGTVLRPLLWNIFFKDTGDILRNFGFIDVAFADESACGPRPCGLDRSQFSSVSQWERRCNHTEWIDIVSAIRAKLERVGEKETGKGKVAPE